MARYRERYAWERGDHGIGEIARRNAEADYHEKFDGDQRTQNYPDDYGTAGNPEPYDRGYRDEYGRYMESYSARTGHRRAGGYHGRGPKNYARSDERILEDICERLWDADDVDASDVTVEVKNGEVTLRGNVEHRSIRHRIEDIADSCGGVNDIHNEIRVQPRNEWPYNNGVTPGTTDNSRGNPKGRGQGEGMVQSAIEQMPPK